jgi:hypothetical protein
MWEIEATDEFREWYAELSNDEAARVNRAVDELARQGPALGRPWADTISASRHRNMKELRPRGGFIRILFAFDPRRTAILLLGGDKRDQRDEWYEVHIPLADRLYEQYLRELATEGLLPGGER